MTADERADPGAIDRGDAAHINDQVPLSAAKELLNVLLERFGGSAAHERHLRRKDEAVGGSCRIGPCAVRELYTGPEARLTERSRTDIPPIRPALQLKCDVFMLAGTDRDRYDD